MRKNKETPTETVDAFVYDTFVPKGQKTHRFFSEPIGTKGKTLWHTNLHLPSRLPYGPGSTYHFSRIGLKAFGVLTMPLNGATIEKYIRSVRGSWTLVFRNKTYMEGTLGDLAFLGANVFKEPFLSETKNFYELKNPVSVPGGSRVAIDCEWRDWKETDGAFGLRFYLLGTVVREAV